MHRTCAPLLAAVLLGGCLEAEDDVVQWSEDFETCGTCTWTIDGIATVVTTNHPGEHAVELERGATLRHGLALVRMIDPDPDQGWDWGGSFTDGNWIEYSSDCPGRPALTLAAVGPAAPDAIDVTLALAGPADGRFTRWHLTFPRLPIEPPIDPEASPLERVTFRDLAITSDGRCRIDNLRIMVSGGTLGY